MSLKNKNIILTGATGGLGKEIAKQLITEGANLLLTGRHKDSLEKIKSELASLATVIGTVNCFVCDISKSADQQSLFNHCQSIDFETDILINNAGVNEFSLLEDSDGSEFENIILTNLLAPISLTHTFLPILRERDEATIVNIGSILGSLGLPGYSVYSASKYGLRGFSEALRRELADTSVRVLYFAPRAINTKMNSSAVQKMNVELGSASDDSYTIAAELIKALANRNIKQKLIGGQERFFTRLNGLFPSLVDKALKSQLNIVKKYSKENKPL
ncbi:MAG: short-subunit dehydrogenase [Enterobacterales bacterium]|jgi:short-subunit dehydrogenase